MTYPDLLGELRKLGLLKYNWYSVAVTVGKLKGAIDGPPQPVRRLRDASDACGYSVNTLNRIVATREFWDAVKGNVPEFKGMDANTLPFTSIEIVKRLHQVESMQGIRMLIEVAAGRITFRKLKELYNAAVAQNTNAASAHQIARFEMRDFEDAAMKAILSSSEKLFGKGNWSIERQKSAPFLISAVAYKQGTQDKLQPVFGLDFSIVRAPEKPINLDVLLLRTLVSASFFRRYWVIFASNTGDQRIKDFCMILEALNRPSIGVAVLPWGKEKETRPYVEELRIDRNPTDNPSPEWHQKIYIVRNLRNSMNSPISSTLRT